MTNDRAYGALGRIGVVTPQANPTAELEVGVLLPARVSMVVARCTSTGDSVQRLRDYMERLGDTLQRFDTMPLDAVGFACTGSSYVLGHNAASRGLRSLEERFKYPVVGAAEAIEAALSFLGARRVALACPYPQWLLEAAHSYWAGRGYDIVVAQSAQADSGDTRAIYDLNSADAAKAIRHSFTGVDADVLLITGTGMPSLQLVSELTEEHRVPVLSSNLCLAWQCLQEADIPAGEHAPEDALPLLGGWMEKLGHL